jgi:molecular chaperone GrpE
VADAPEKGNFSTNISEDVVRAALDSVKKHTSHSTEEGVELSVDSSPEESSKEVEALKAQLEFSQAKGRELMEKIKDTHEKMLRATADLDNFKKRAAKEKEEVQKFGIERLLKDILPVLDNLDRALAHVGPGVDPQALRQGVEMVRKHFEDTLAKHGVKAFTAVGQLFDPRVHEAMSQVATSEVPPQHVVSEMVRGFTLNDRLVRPALVTVAIAPTQASQTTTDSPAEPDSSGSSSGSNT